MISCLDMATNRSLVSLPRLLLILILALASFAVGVMDKWTPADFNKLSRGSFLHERPGRSYLKIRASSIRVSYSISVQ